MTELATRIEIFLLTEHRWVSAKELCQRFHVKMRALRGRQKVSGLCTEFAISGDEGYRHVRCATDDEFERFTDRLRTHGIAELFRVKRLRMARQTARSGKPPLEKFTGQTLLL